MRLLCALWLPPAAVSALVEAGGDAAAPRGWRVVAPTAWHLTLARHDDDPGGIARRLDRQASGVPVPRLRLTGFGGSRWVRWADVDVAPQSSLVDLVTAAGGDRAAFRPHVTLLRRRRRARPDDDPDPRVPWSGHRGPWWRPN